ncbi:type II secretion system protein GspG [bacterium E08(2017)]|nr:type II secretion system protein GspG [bacterium E08(2017)]
MARIFTVREKSKKAGFTLVELLVVVAIILILTSYVGVRIMSRPDEAKIAAARAQIDTFKLALSAYRLDNGFIPTEEQGLEALVEIPTTEPIPENYTKDGRYIDSRAVPMDPWGNEYVYMEPGTDNERYEIICYGADGEPGGEDEDADISSADM